MSLVIKVLWKLISLIYFRVYLEVNVHKNPTALAVGVSEGGDGGENEEIYIYADNGKERKIKNTSLNGWKNWQEPEINNIEVKKGDSLTIGIIIKAGAGAWGTLDDFVLMKEEKTSTPKIQKLVRKGKKMSILVSGDKENIGYEMIYSTNKKFKAPKKVVLFQGKKKTVTVFSSKKKYYVKVRAYTLDSMNSKVYSKYSKVKVI